MKKRITALFLAVVFLMAAAVPAGAIANPFKDVSSGAYYYKAVLWALENGVTAGTSKNTFSPAATCTRGQVVTFLWRAQGQPEPVTTENVFADVTEKDYFYKPVLWAVENSITNGTSATTFSPNATCTRAQVLTFLWRAEGKPAAISTSKMAAAYAAQYYGGAVAWADADGMLSNMGGKTFNPAENCPRSDIVTYLYRYETGDAGVEYVLNNNTMVFHLPSCYHAGRIHAEHRETTSVARAKIIQMGYTPCQVCHP